MTAVIDTTTWHKPVLDHGYVRLIETWGSDQAIIEAARMSTGKGFLAWSPYWQCRRCKQVSVKDVAETPPHPGGCSAELDAAGYAIGKHDWRDVPKGDAGLLRYLYEKNHATPFEFGGMVIEVKAPLMVFREWHRHRCLSGDTMLHFELPGGTRRGKRQLYQMPIAEVWRKWQPTVRSDRPDRQENALWPRSRIAGMQLRCVNEETREVTFTHVVNVVRGHAKVLYRLTTLSGKTIRATADHLFFTDRGWLRLEDAVARGALVAVTRTQREAAMHWDTPAVDESTERWRDVLSWEGLYEVSDAGRVRRVGRDAKRGTIGAQGYPVVSLNRPGVQQLRTIHSLVLEAWHGPRPSGSEARHLNSNRLDARSSNLAWGTALENAADQVAADRVQRLTVGFEEIAECRKDGTEVTYDLEVADPWHNFVADGFVVHNSQGYNEASARYAPLPDENYVPTAERCMAGGGHLTKQAGTIAGAAQLTEADALTWLAELADVYDHAERVYQSGLKRGIPKELARLPVPVGRYSKMRATTNLRMWLAFSTLRSTAKNPAAQWEIRQYADVVGELLDAHFPRTWAIFSGAAS